jgi:predicted amidohydrolase
MPLERKFLVAAAQMASVFLNKAGAVEKAKTVLAEAAARGARLVVFPETWIPTFPWWTMYDSRWKNPAARKAYRLSYEQSLDIPGPETDELSSACRELKVHLVMGVQERVPTGTLYNAMVFIDSNGALLGKRRKLVPTYFERLMWGRGDGSTLRVFDTEIGRLGGLMCYENLMPLARYYLYSQGLQLHAAVWPSPVEPYDLACRNLAVEGRCFVVAAAGLRRKSDVPDDFPMREQMMSFAKDASGGGSCIIGPDGKYIAEPGGGTETIVYGEVDLDRIVEEKQVFDVAGHYARPDVFSLEVNTRETLPAVATGNRSHE